MLTLMITASLLPTVLVGNPEHGGINRDVVAASIAIQGAKVRDPAEALKSVELIRASLAKGGELEESVGKKLLMVVANAQVNGLVRHAALRLQCDYASGDGAEMTVAVMASLLHRLPSPKDDQHPNSEYYVIPGLLHTFVTNGAKVIDSRLRNPEILLEFHASILEDSGFHFEHIRQGCIERIADSKTALSVRQSYMLRLVEGMADRPAPEAFHTLVNNDVIEPLRRIAFHETSGYYGYNAAAVGLLVEFGDMVAARWFRAWAEQHGYDEAAVTMVGGFVWRVEAQHKPDMLLDHIRSSERADMPDRIMRPRHRLWALKKAIQLDVDRERLRSTLIEHFRQVGSKRVVESVEEALCNLALENGIVKTTDLPEVTLSSQDKRTLKRRRAFERMFP